MLCLELIKALISLTSIIIRAFPHSRENGMYISISRDPEIFHSKQKSNINNYTWVERVYIYINISTRTGWLLGLASLSFIIGFITGAARLGR